MKFARIPLNEAVGTILAHSVVAEGGIIKKGRTLGADEIGRLRRAGQTAVVAARLEPGDVGEDIAAARVASAATGENIRKAEPFTGRANLYADADGLTIIDQAAIAAINAIDEGLTIATVLPYERVTAGQMLATIKIITFAVPEAAVAQAVSVAAANGGALRVAALARKTAGLILTRMPSTKDNVLRKRREAIARRLSALGSTLGLVETVDHEEVAVKDAILRLKSAGADPILLFAASAIVDRGDVIPSGLVMAGGEILRLGMPVDPGNLMLLGKLGNTAVIGAPSCAASPKLNGFDWVLERLLAGLQVESPTIAAMGVGGLLKEIPTRPQPRDGTVDEAAMDENMRRAPRIGIILLAAGRSTRFGGPNKLLASLDDAPLVRRTAEALLTGSARPLVVVTGHMADEVANALTGLDLQVVHNPAFAEGLSTSLKRGITALPKDIEGVIVALGDMPRIAGHHIDRLIAGFAPKENRSIVVPVFQGKRGNPVLFSTELFAEMMEVAGDTGARHIIGSHADLVAEVDLGTDAIFLDVDTQDALAKLTSERQKP